MTRGSPARRANSGALAAWIGVCVFALQALLLSFHARAETSASHFLAQYAVEATCGERDGGLPANSERGPRHCAFCLTGDRGTCHDLVAVAGVTATVEAPGASTKVLPRGDVVFARMLAGWASSWSARAPPTVF